MSGPDGGHRLLLVHAHPDDESIGTGATMAKYAAEGAGVTLVTCTLGELGEVIPPELAHLAADADGGLGEYRIGELAAACAALGVTDHRFLGGPGRWRDSGMMGLPSNDAPGSFWQADVDEAAGELLSVISEVRPQVLISYDDNGFYGHPDHIQAHRVAWRAFELAGGLVTKFYATAVPRSVLAAGIEGLRGSRVPGAEAGRDARARHPDRRGQPVLRVLRQRRPARVRARVLHAAGRPPRARDRAARSRERPFRRDWLAFCRGERVRAAAWPASRV